MKRRTFLASASLLGVPGAAAAGNPDLSTPIIDDRRIATSVREYGATGDGVTDDSSAIQAAVDANQSVFFPAGNYRVEKGIRLSSGASLTGHRGANLINGGNGYLLYATGRIHTLRAIRKDAMPADPEFHIASDALADFEVGSGFYLQSERSPLGRTDHKAAEIGIVKQVASRTIGVVGALSERYAMSDSAMSAAVTFIDSVSVSGLNLRNAYAKENPDSRTSALIYLEFVRDFQIFGCRLVENNGTGVAVFNCISGIVQGNTIGDLGDRNQGVLGYGVQLGYSTRDVLVSGNAFHSCRHAVTTGTGTRSSQTPGYGVSRGLSVVGNTVSQCSNAALDTHEDTNGITFAGNTVHSCDSVGIHIRCHGSVVSGNTISTCRGAGVRVSNSAQNAVVSANNIQNIWQRGRSGDGIIVDARSVSITDNVVSGCGQHGVAIQRHATSGIILGNNTCQNYGRERDGNGINFGSGGEVTHTIINANLCMKDPAAAKAGAAFAMTRGTRLNASNCVVANNIFDDQ